jgi:hypothetical protein
MWILQILPDWVFHLILLVGLVGLGASFVLKFISFVAQYKLPIQVASSILIVIGIFMEGAILNQTWWELRVSEAEKRALIAEALAAEANGKIEYKIVEKVKVVEVVDRKVQQQIKDLAIKMDERCYIIPEVNTIHNDAATARKQGAKK